MDEIEQKELLRKYIEMLVFTGYDITDLLCKPLDYFNFNEIKKQLKKYHKI